MIISADGTAVAFDQSGDGPPLVIVGGLFSQRDHIVVTELAELLAPHFTVYNYDRRGRSDSSETLLYAIEREIEDLAALVTETGGAAHVFGMSSGAALATAAAAQGIAITKLVLHEPPFTVHDARPVLPPDHKEQLDALIESGRRGDTSALKFTAAMRTPRDVMNQIRHAPFWPALEALAHTLRCNATVLGDTTLPIDRLTEITIPTLVIVGENSAAWLRHAARATAEVIPNAELCSLAGQNHAATPASIAPVLIQFLRG